MSIKNMCGETAVLCPFCGKLLKILFQPCLDPSRCMQVFRDVVWAEQPCLDCQEEKRADHLSSLVDLPAGQTDRGYHRA